MSGLSPEFRPVDPERHADLCIAFRRDSFVISFGHDSDFGRWAGQGAEGYLADLRERIERWPGSVVHLWMGEDIAGQVELRLLEEPADCGYVNLFYVVRAFRRRGLGGLMEDYAVRFFRQYGCRTARLSVSPSNKAAIAFYQGRGWRLLGPEPGELNVLLFEKALTPETPAPTRP